MSGDVSAVALDRLTGLGMWTQMNLFHELTIAHVSCGQNTVCISLQGEAAVLQACMEHSWNMCCLEFSFNPVLLFYVPQIDSSLRIVLIVLL